MLEYAGPVQSALRELAGWQSPRDYWFPEIRSLAGAIAGMSLVLYPYVYLLARAAFLDQSVCALEVSRTLGRGPWRSFFTVALPLARPAIVVGVALALMEVLNDFGAVQQFAVNTFTTGIYDVWLGMHNAPAAAQLACLLLGFVLVLIGLERSSRRARHYHQTTRRYRVLPGYRLTGWRAFGALAATFSPLILGFVLPGLVLADWAWLTLGIVEHDDFLADVTNTLALAAAAALLAITVATFLAYALRLSGGRLLTGAVRLASTGYAVPGSVIAVGVLLPFAWADHGLNAVTQSLFGLTVGLVLSGTVVAVVFAYLVRFLALSFGSVEASLGRITIDMDGAARTLGHDAAQTLRRVHLPLIRGGVLTAALLVFVDVMKELPATLILRPFDFSTLATRIYEYASDERFEETGLWALAIVVAGIAPVILLSIGIRRSRPGSTRP
jgi:iron(III) transport system permease protein